MLASLGANAATASAHAVSWATGSVHALAGHAGSWLLGAVAPTGTTPGGRPLGLSEDASSGWLHELFFRRVGISDVAADSEALFMMIFAFCLFFFVLLMVLMVYFVIKYRRRPGVPAPVSPSHNTPLEIVWTIVPSSSLLVIFLLGYWGFMQHVVASGPQPIQLEVKGWKWGWSVAQPNGATSTETQLVSATDVPVFVVPERTPIQFRMSSQDVIHSFWIPDLRVKFDVFPNRYTGYTFTTLPLNEDEEYRDLWVFCAEYCGTKHSEMAAVIRVMRRADYDQWLRDAAAPDDPVLLGQQVWEQKCKVCHSVDGGIGTGPTWQGGMIAGADWGYGYGYPAQFTDGTRLEARDSNYLREAILVPGASVVAGYPNQMPSFSGLLNDAQLDGVIMYMQSLSDRGPALDGAGGEDGEEGGEEAGDPEGEAEGGTPEGDDASGVDEPGRGETGSDG